MNRKNKNINRITGAGILLLILFIVFIQRTNLSWVRNWWAFLFLIPAIGSINNVFSEGQSKKGFTFSMASNLVGILFPVVLCLIFLFGLNWEINLPIIIILAGVTLLVLGFVIDTKGAGKIIWNLRFWFFSWGIAVILVGGIALISTTTSIFNQQNLNPWYASALVLSSIGGFITVFFEFKKSGKITPVAIMHFLVAIFLTIPAILILLS